MMSQTWLVTGASSGLGTAITASALRAGNKVLAAARNPEKASLENPQIEALGGKWVNLDVTQTDTARHVETIIHENGGLIDVVVNNAGYSLVGSIEDMSEDEIECQLSTNFKGPIRVLKGVLPFMRAQRSGTIVNVSSSAGVQGFPACGIYAGSKFALEGLSEALATELLPFGIRVLIVEPGIFRTKFLSAFVTPQAGMTEDYAGTPVETMIHAFRTSNGNQQGNPVKAAARILDVVSGTGMGVGKEKLLRLPLGPDCHDLYQAKCDSLKENLVETKEIAYSTNFE
ncbi:hypothetical protein PENSTE_c005G07593 [Penicillium steckii]|uniref:Uncharacterized protein n=1 Tax=Penicillium steckii TaxID=303698 RepID=A0A1V6TIV0_9EURO|nr:hypothetical protein PENSTE_c005G07593 [Penicillium steckii]